ncbi:sigma-70 family RNA polymerase sigma factor [Actinoplanes sp. URMC 104]|uniref:sigma-70 family RNA polymerase sigma factor n=1 Tax=Actinoplanes sp. URMC 104 TaxID=3423409 RepID=UPI003F195524
MGNLRFAQEAGTLTQSQIAPDVTRLVRQAQDGDVAARDELIAEHLPLIYNIVGRALDGHPDVDDLVQETMLRAVRGLGGLREPDLFRSWLIAIAYRQIQLHLRARRTTRVRPMPTPVDVPDPVSDFAERTTAELVVADQRRELIEATRWLDDDDKRLLGLWWQEAAGELTRTELAAALDVQPKHAAVRVQRMKAQLDAARGVVRALRSRPRCPALMAQAKRWDGVAGPLWRKRLVRHVRDCPQCTLGQHGLVAPEQLLLGIAALPVPAALISGILSSAKLSSSLLPPKLLAAAAVASVAVGGGIVYAVHETPLDPPRAVVAPPPAAVRPSLPGAVARPRATATRTPARVIGAGVQRADLYVAPTGSDRSGDGTIGKPYATLEKATSRVRPGQTIALRGGTYRLASEVEITTSGTAARRIVLSNYRDERPVIDAGRLPGTDWAIDQTASYWTVQGLEIRNATSHAYVCSGCRGNVFQRLTLRGNTRAGMMLRDPGTGGNRVLDSDFSGSDGIGLGLQFGSGAGNVVRGNRFSGNRGSGLDLNFDSPVVVEGNWAYDNGGNGFVLTGAPASHRLRNNAAWDNGNHGFTDDGGATRGLTLVGNTAFRNRGSGFALPGGAAVLRANVAVDNAGEPAGLAAGSTASGNSWQQSGFSADRFRSTDPSSAEGPRTAAGRLPATSFLTGGGGASMDGG